MVDISETGLPPRNLGERQASLFLALVGRRPERVLDIGCGRGEHLSIIAKECGAEGVGIDVDEDAIEVAREQAKDMSVRFLIADGTNLPPEISKQRFDLILLIGSRVTDYGVFSPLQVAKNIDSYLDLLTENGRLVLKENTDFSGRIESTVGWYFKTAAQIDGLLNRGSKLIFYVGLERYNPTLIAIPIIRGVASQLVKTIHRILGRQCSFVIVMPKPTRNKTTP